METKHCPKCKKDKNREAFAKRGGKRTDLQSWCKQCIQERKITDRAIAYTEKAQKVLQHSLPTSGLHFSANIIKVDEGLSQTLQVGKVGEHLVCADAIMQGYNAYLSDAGLPYDVIVDTGFKLFRVQVKTTTQLIEYARTAGKVYRFGLRSGNSKKIRRVSDSNVDVIAFVALDCLRIAYMPIADVRTDEGFLKLCVEFKTRAIQYPGRMYSNGTQRIRLSFKYLEDYWRFPGGS